MKSAEKLRCIAQTYNTDMGIALRKAADELDALLAYAKAEQALHDESKYSPDELAKSMGMPPEYKCIGDWLDFLRTKAIAINMRNGN